VRKARHTPGFFLAAVSRCRCTTLANAWGDNPSALRVPRTNAIVRRWDITGSAFGEHATLKNPDGDTATYTINLRSSGQCIESQTRLSAQATVGTRPAFLLGAAVTAMVSAVYAQRRPRAGGHLH